MGWGAYIFAPSGPRLTPEESRSFAQANPFGFILFARNVENPDQLRQLTHNLRSAAAWDAPIFIDQEGGRVARMGAPHWRVWAPPLDDVARLGALAEEGFTLRYRIIAAELRAVGIDGNCAPLGDIARPDAHPVLKSRCYGSDAHTVFSLARSAARGLMEGGVLPVVKHLPGHGRVKIDIHLDLPVVDATHQALTDSDFAVFTGLSDLPMAMTAHLVSRAIDDKPATLSAPLMDLIRKEIGFCGLLITDDISMEALSGTVRDRGAAALAAGCDVVLHCNGDLIEMRMIADLGQLTPQAQGRAQRALGLRTAPKEVDIEALAEEFASLYRRTG